MGAVKRPEEFVVRHTRATLAVVHLSVPGVPAFGHPSRQNSFRCPRRISALAAPITGGTVCLEGNRP